jgi:predicted Fe-Mo cluster-binding NifX family protein
MRLALSAFKDGISTVFDASDQFLIIETDGPNDFKKISEKFLTTNPAGRALQLKNQEIDVLICGAISRQMQTAIISQGITVHSFIRGQVNDIVEAYQRNQLGQTDFLLPGCRRRLRGNDVGRQRGSRCRW